MKEIKTRMCVSARAENFARAIKSARDLREKNFHVMSPLSLG